MPDKPRTFGQKAKTKQSRKGGSTALRDRSAAFQRLREAMLSQEPLCRYCAARGHVTPASIADHIVALSLGGSNEPTNLAPACKHCNDEKGKLEKRYADRGYDPAFIHLDPELGEWIRLSRAPQSRP